MDTRPSAAATARSGLTTLYNPNVRLAALVEVVSSISPQANGLWQVTSLQHELSSLVPDGPWFTEITAIGRHVQD